MVSITAFKEGVQKGLYDPSQAIMVTPPFYNTIWFWIGVICLMILIVSFIYFYFRVILRNKTNVIIHMPDKSRKFYSYKNYTGDSFNILSSEKDKDGKPIEHRYFFKLEAVETGYWGKYIEYDYGISEPRKSYGQSFSDIRLLYKFISGLLNTDLAVDLLLSQKFKDFVKMMLVMLMLVLCIGCGITIGLYFYSPPTQCILVPNNVTIQTLRIAMGK